ncbi:hypothetical protein SMACR_00029 [Sordaria macrospora]|uniref:WGS project CABT00000000 data, contig 2.1 n=2 Tax=Sordaria macrospora TaxID=5147 RepID=F7VJY6_SORMK|nr:uncharacterized protein SMAC_00029 [Sordaria macrospora k-hell]KAA8629101.1 hypothetical protein SMACR_00029 [Sordaria macrospora]KAH7636120.1 hypothetical protein B0T09DRAFT_330563 [Sordaria sp. MPI-SDFR-AT-0083]WPJ64566.1 hypothetical protein SMAC4_00029 [Sordaria macrospora]CCC05813.1 unnamed protein product [Sordaria macrospora k-hell]
MFSPPNCTVIPSSAPSDAGIAGVGVLISSSLTATIALLLSASLILQSTLFPNSNFRPSTIRRKLLASYSDQQILIGIGLQALGLARSSHIIPYHFFIIWMLSLLSMATHNATLLALVQDFKRDWVLRWMRQGLMFVNLALSCVYGVIVLEGKRKGWDARGTLPVGCIWAADSATGLEEDKKVAGGLDYVGTIVTIAGNVVVFGLATWYLQSRRQKWYRIVQLVGMLLMMGIAIGAAVRVFLLSQAFGKPDVQLSDEGEKQLGFGSLLGLLMMALPIISIIEIKRGDVMVAPPLRDDASDDEKPLV